MRWSTIKHGIWLIGVLIASLLLSGCGSEASADTLTSTGWELRELHGRDVLDDVSVTMLLGGDNDLSGSGGCNRYTGEWDTGDGFELSLTPGGTTMMACDQPIADQEQAFLAALSTTASYQLSDTTLALMNVEGVEVASFDKLHPAQLTRTQWEATGINNGQQGVVGILDGTMITAIFDTDDMLTGNSGCNTYRTSFSRDDDEITIEESATTLMVCDQPVMDQESWYLEALSQAATYELGHETLYLRAEDGVLLVSFRKAP